MKKAKKRLFTTDYGTTQGHCMTVKNAMKSAVCYMIDNGQKHCTIEGPDGAMVRARYNLHFGLALEPVRRSRAKLRAVK